MSPLHPLIAAALEDARNLPLTLARAYHPIDMPDTCEGCGDPLPPDGLCPCWGRL